MLSQAQMIEAAGGTINGKFVEHFGIKEIASTTFVADDALLKAFRIKGDTPLEEMNARITYLSDSGKEDYLRKIIQRKHNIYHGDFISFVIAGVKESTVLELVSSGTFKCDRLTTSKTKAASDTLYVKTKIPERYVEEFAALRERVKLECAGKGLLTEELNEFNLETKAMSLILHGNVYDLYRYCIKKIEEDYEYELQEVCKAMKVLLEEKPIIKMYKEEFVL